MGYFSNEGDVIDFANGGHSSLSGEGEDFLRGLAESVAHEGMIGMEVGSYTGWTASQVIPTFVKNGGKYHILDWFRGSVDTQVGNWVWGNFPCQDTLIRTIKNIELQGWLEHVSISISTGDLMAPVIADGVLDYCYIGADHRYTGIKNDIEKWLPKIRKGGIICGHAFTGGPIDPESEQFKALCEEPEGDFYHSAGCHFGVVRAVQELLPNYWRIGNGLWASNV